MTNVPYDPDANPTYGKSKAINEEITGAGTGGTGTDAMTDPGAVVLSQGLADQIAAEPGTVVPNGTKITPSTTPNSSGVTTIEYPATHNSVASKVTVVPYVRDSNGNITNADKAGIVMPSVMPVGFTASGNPVSDVQSLLDNHATLEQVQAYMALNNVSWGQLSGPEQATLGKMGYSTAGSGDSYEFDSPDKSIGKVYVPINQWDSWTPQQQLAFQIKLKLTPSDARLVINKDGSWGYTSKSAAPAQTKQTPAAAGKDTDPLAKYTDANGNVDVRAALAGGVTADYITQHTGASLNDIHTAQTINKVTSVLKANKDGTYNTDDIAAAVSSGKLTQADVDTVFDKQTTVKTTTTGTPASLTGDRINSDIAGATYPASYSQDDWDADIASGKIPKGATFVSYDSETGIINYTTSTTTPVPATPAAHQSALDIVKNILTNPFKSQNYTQDELKAAYDNYRAQAVTGKDAQAALKTLTTSKDSFGQGISALGTLYHFITQSNPVGYDPKTGKYGVIVKGEVSIGGDSAIEEAVQAASEVDDWDKVLSSVNDASADARAQGLNIDNMPMKTNEGVTQMSPNTRGTSFNTNPDYISEWTQRMAATGTAQEQPLAIQQGSIVITPQIAAASKIATSTYTAARAAGATPVQATAYTRAVVANVVTTGKVSANPVAISKVTAEQAQTVNTAVVIGTTLSEGIAKTVASSHSVSVSPTTGTSPVTAKTTTDAVTKAIVMPTTPGKWAIDPETGQTVRTAEQVRQGQGVPRQATVEDVPAWLDNAEFENLKAQGLTTEEIYEILKQSRGNQLMFRFLAEQVLKTKATKKANIKKAFEVLNNVYVAPAAWEKVIGSQRNTHQADMGAAVGQQAEREADVMTFIKITRGPDNKPVITTWQVAMPALVRGMTEQIKQADLTDMKFSTELEEQAYRKALAAQAAALGNRILKASKTNTAVNIQNLTDTKDDTKGNTILNMALNTSIADATTTKLGITTTNEIKNATATNTQTKTNVQPSTKTVTPVQIITGTHNPPPDNNNKKSPPDISLKPYSHKDTQAFVHVPQGSATWKQGFGYRTLIPPYRQQDFIFTMKPPKGAVIVPNAKSAMDTIQKLGKGNLPADMNVKMGIMTVDVKDPPNRPQKHSGSIAFKRIPITNNTGSRNAPPHAARIGNGITRRNDR
jgi:hypothetical protein